MVPKRLLQCVNGKRGGALLIAGAGWLAIGLSYTIGPVTRSRIRGFAWLPEWLDSTELGWLWIVSAVIAIGSAVIGAKKLENIAFGALMMPPVLWAAIFAYAFWIGEHDHGWISSISYVTFAGLIWHCSSWPNPARLPPDSTRPNHSRNADAGRASDEVTGGFS